MPRGGRSFCANVTLGPGRPSITPEQFTLVPSETHKRCKERLSTSVIGQGRHRCPRLSGAGSVSTAGIPESPRWPVLP
ncbi:hypothetical protein CITRIK5_70853 [Citricoccus sp. K5]|nr:hypothetical protein CITRIK5_70853 [Citricoccus sp. K5]